MPTDLVRGQSRPNWVGNDGGTSPYNSTWFVHLRKKAAQQNALVCLERYCMAAAAKDWVIAQSIKGTRWKLKKALQKSRNRQWGATDQNDAESSDAPATAKPFEGHADRWEGTVEINTNGTEQLGSRKSRRYRRQPLASRGHGRS